MSAAGDVLGRAFADDPGFVYLFPGERARPACSRWLCRRVVAYGHRYGWVDAAEAAAAIWMEAGADFTLGMGRMLRVGLVAAPFRLGPGPVARLLRLTGVLEEAHRRHAPVPHFYLFFLGVDPPAQGKGRGGALVRPVLERADLERRVCYLETMKERNLAFYTKNGFEVCEEARVAADGPTFWAMRRDPA